MMESKETLRMRYKNVRECISDERRRAARAAAAALDCGEEKYVLSFASLPYEIDTEQLNRRLLEQQRLALPAFVNKQLLFRKVESLESLEVGAFGILEPTGEIISPDKISFALIPGLIFDRSGGRIGYGFGHYDRLLTDLKYKVGLCFKEQLFEGSLPSDPWDIPVDRVIAL